MLLPCTGSDRPIQEISVAEQPFLEKTMENRRDSCYNDSQLNCLQSVVLMTAERGRHTRPFRRPHQRRNRRVETEELYRCAPKEP